VQPINPKPIAVTIRTAGENSHRHKVPDNAERSTRADATPGSAVHNTVIAAGSIKRSIEA
jgi:hypothetical protein